MSVRDTQPLTPLTVGDIPEKRYLPVTGNNSRSNWDKPPDYNSAQKASSTLKEEEPKEGASETESEESKVETLRT